MDQSLEAQVRIVRFVLLIVLSIPAVTSSAAQQTPVSDAEAIKLLRQALVALNPGTPTTDVTLSGSVRHIAGSNDETGSAVLKAVGDTSSIVLNLASGVHSEVRSVANGEPSGSWSGSDGVNHPVPFHNVLSEPVWFYPGFGISRGLSPSGYLVTYVGAESNDGQKVHHISVTKIQNELAPGEQAFFQHLSQIDFFLDTTTFLPAAISFNTHPDYNALLDIPVEVRFSDYRSVGGALIPFHVEKFINNVLSLDLQLQSATLNTGVSVRNFNREESSPKNADEKIAVVFEGTL